MNDWDHEQWKDVESRHEQSITPGIWQLLNKVRSPSILQTQEMSREEKMLQILSLEKGSFTSHVTTIFIVKEELIHLQCIVGVVNERNQKAQTRGLVSPRGLASWSPERRAAYEAWF